MFPASEYLLTFETRHNRAMHGVNFSSISNTTGGRVFPGCQLHSGKASLSATLGEEAHGEAAFPECQKLHTRGRLRREAKKHSGKNYGFFKKIAKGTVAPSSRPAASVLSRPPIRCRSRRRARGESRPSRPEGVEAAASESRTTRRSRGRRRPWATTGEGVVGCGGGSEGKGAGCGGSKGARGGRGREGGLRGGEGRGVLYMVRVS
jgi:hypothetical protein